MTTYGQRQLKGREVCERLVQRIAEVAPTGIGLWDEAWTIVDGPSADFMVALSSWESDPTAASMARVTLTYERVVAAWGAAAVQYQRRATA